NSARSQPLSFASAVAASEFAVEFTRADFLSCAAKSSNQQRCRQPRFRESLNAKLLDHRYGKSLVRVLKVLRSGATHTIKELSVAVSLEGDFESAYTAGDNSKVVPTDTM